MSADDDLHRAINEAAAVGMSPAWVSLHKGGRP